MAQAQDRILTRMFFSEYMFCYQYNFPKIAEFEKKHLKGLIKNLSKDEFKFKTLTECVFVLFKTLANKESYNQMTYSINSDIVEDMPDDQPFYHFKDGFLICNDIEDIVYDLDLYAMDIIEMLQNYIISHDLNKLEAFSYVKDKVLNHFLLDNNIDFEKITFNEYAEARIISTIDLILGSFVDKLYSLKFN